MNIQWYTEKFNFYYDIKQNMRNNKLDHYLLTNKKNNFEYICSQTIRTFSYFL